MVATASAMPVKVGRVTAATTPEVTAREAVTARSRRMQVPGMASSASGDALGDERRDCRTAQLVVGLAQLREPGLVALARLPSRARGGVVATDRQGQQRAQLVHALRSGHALCGGDGD